MTITSFNPLIVTQDAESAVKLFEELGFERRHTKQGIGEDNATDIRMKDANGFHVDVSQGTGEWTMIRMNVDNLEEAIAFLEVSFSRFLSTPRTATDRQHPDFQPDLPLDLAIRPRRRRTTP